MLLILVLLIFMLFILFRLIKLAEMSRIQVYYPTFVKNFVMYCGTTTFNNNKRKLEVEWEGSEML